MSTPLSTARSIHSGPYQLKTAQRSRRREQVPTQQIWFGLPLTVATDDHLLRHIRLVDHVQPVSKAVTALGNLQLNGTNDGVVGGRDTDPPAGGRVHRLA